MCIASSDHKSVPLEEMGKTKFRSLREIYDSTEKVSQPKPSDFQTEEKLMTSDVHGTRSSFGMHFKQVASIVGGGIGCVTDKVSKGKRASHDPSAHKVLLIPSLKQCASSEQFPSECTDEQAESSFAKAVTKGLNGPIYGVHDCATFAKTDHRLNPEDPAIETESQSYCERHLEKSDAVVKNGIMQEPRKSQPVVDVARVCSICGAVGQEQLLAICSKCTEGAEHIYCKSVKLKKVQDEWVGEGCLLMTDSRKSKQNTLKKSVRISKDYLEYQQSRDSVSHESKCSERYNLRSLGSYRSGTDSPSSTSQLSAKRPATTLEAHSMNKARVTGKSPLTPTSTKSCTGTLVCEDFSCKNLKRGKIEAATSVLQFSGKSQDKAGIPCACGDRRIAGSLEAELGNKRRKRDTEVVPPRVAKPIKRSPLRRERPFKNLETKQMEDIHNVTSQKKFYNGMQGKAELPAILGSNSPELGKYIGMSRDEGSLHDLRSFETADMKLKGQQARDECLQKHKFGRSSAFHHKSGKDPGKSSKSLSLNSVSSDETDDTGPKVHPRKDSLFGAPELCDPAICLPAYDSGATTVEAEKETICGKQPVISGSNCHKCGAVQSVGKPYCELKPTICITHEDLNHNNKEEMDQIWQVECPAEATTDVKTDKLCSDFASNEMPKLRKLPQFDVRIPSVSNAIPEYRHIWQGEFLINSREGIESSCKGIQSHLSTKASPKVLEVVDRFAKILLLEQLPRLSTWPSEFHDRPVTEDNIALYFFAKNHQKASYTRLLNYMKENDIALKGKFGGVELLIFSSHVLPENSASWNTSPYLWGLFKVQRVENSTNREESNSQRNENRDRRRSWTPDLNVCPPDKEGTGRVHDDSRCLDLNVCPPDEEVTERVHDDSRCLVLNMCPPDEECTGRVHDDNRCLDLSRCFSKNGEFDTADTIHPGVGTLLGRDGFSDQRQPHPSAGENNYEHQVVDLLFTRPQNWVPVEMEVDTELSLWSQNSVPVEMEVDTELSLWSQNSVQS